MATKSDRQKLRKCQLIENNWRCNVKDSIPPHIRPRISLVRGSRVKIGTKAPESSPSEWSLDFLAELERLSALTAGKLVFAQELMTLEAQQRQQDLTHRWRDTAELLPCDLGKINNDLRERALESGFDNDDEDVSDEGEEEEGERNNGEQSNLGLKDTNIKTEAVDADVDMVTDGQIASKTNIGNPSIFTAKNNLRTRAQIASLRADAMRLKQEAARRKAEAYELEAKMLRAEAKEFDSTTIKIED